ncbi:hypothetical protein ARMGADRAFT_1028246 [Armillaria gallica]|uniref:Uncharacterized protein n=1 Tax=Armillaria gallica TaxID=47427 RepID=A0A2H3DPL1_ARMGA|nr:hypothetical protein ARMGADRAFT_1028246 [Armillaria gallica]
MYSDSQRAILGDRTNVYDDNNVNTGNDNDSAKKALAVQEYEARVVRILHVRLHFLHPRLAEAARETEKYRHCKLFDWISMVQWKPQVTRTDVVDDIGIEIRTPGTCTASSSLIDNDTEERTAPIQDPQHDAQSTPLDISVTASQPLSLEVILLLEMLAPTLSCLQSSPQIAPVEMQ